MGGGALPLITWIIKVGGARNPPSSQVIYVLKYTQNKNKIHKIKKEIHKIIKYTRNRNKTHKIIMKHKIIKYTQNNN